MEAFTAEFKPKDNRPDEPILIGRKFSQARVSVSEAIDLIEQLKKSVVLANLTELKRIEHECARDNQNLCHICGKEFN